MTRKKLGKLIAVIEDPRNFGQKIENHVFWHPLQLDYIEFNWQYLSQISQYTGSVSGNHKITSYNRYDVYRREYMRGIRHWKKYTDSDPLWSNVRYVTLYIFERYDVVISYRNASMPSVVTWYDEINQYGTYESIRTHQDFLRLFKEMKQGYLP